MSDAVRQSERKYQELVEYANSNILRMDPEGKVTFFNEFAQRFFGFSESEMLGRSVIGTIVPVTDDAGHDLKKMIEDIMVNPQNYINNENENMLRDGRRVWIAWTNRPVYDEGHRLKEILCVGNDISEIKKAQEQLKAIDKRKSDFVANVSHEVKSPLAVIWQTLDVLSKGITGDVNEKQKEILETAKKNVMRLVRLVTDLLDISKIEAGKMELKIEEFDMSSLTEEVLTNDESEFSRKKIDLKKDIPPTAGQVMADKDKITEVILNLLSNAIKYTPQGGVISVKLSQADKEVRFEISDTGPEISKENIDKIFDKFERVIVEREEGTGLGLAIAKDIVQLHGGKLWVESPSTMLGTGEIGKGSRFIFTLPRNTGKQ